MVLRAVALKRDGAGLDFRGFRILVAGDDFAGHLHRAADPKGLHRFEVRQGIIVHHLRILEAGSVKEVHEAHILLLAMVADPAKQGHFLTLQLLKAFLQLPGGDGSHVEPLHTNS